MTADHPEGGAASDAGALSGCRWTQAVSRQTLRAREVAAVLCWFNLVANGRSAVCCGLQVVGRLAGNHKAGITSLLTLPSRAEFRSASEQQGGTAATLQQQGRGKPPKQQDKASIGGAAGGAAADAPPVFFQSADLVLAGDASGGMFVWPPFSTPLGSADREVVPRLAWSGHSGEVWALCLTPGPEDATHTAPKVFSAGEEGRARLLVLERLWA